MTLNQTELLAFLSNSKSTAESKRLFKCTLQEFVFEHGWWYEPIEVPKNIATGKQQLCFKNSYDLATKIFWPLIYCEGLYESGALPQLHAWITDGHGKAIDNTWRPRGVAYAGVPFKKQFLFSSALRGGEVVSLIDDYKNKYSLINDVEGHPEKWLERRGLGTAKVGKIS